jgi:hypothetical protein
MTDSEVSVNPILIKQTDGDQNIAIDIVKTLIEFPEAFYNSAIFF